MPVPSIAFDQFRRQYALNKLPSGTTTTSDALRLPPRVWLWNKTAVFVSLANESSEPHAFQVVASHPFEANEWEGDVAARDAVHIEVKLADDADDVEAAMARSSRVAAAAAAPLHRPALVVTDTDGKSAQPEGARPLVKYERASADGTALHFGFLTVIDRQQRLLTTELIGLTGHLIAVDTDPADLHFVPVEVERTSEVQLRLVNRCDMAIALNFSIGDVKVTQDNMRIGPFIISKPSPLSG